jgi:hypothetical protein
MPVTVGHGTGPCAGPTARRRAPGGRCPPGGPCTCTAAGRCTGIQLEVKGFDNRGRTTRFSHISPSRLCCQLGQLTSTLAGKDGAPLPRASFQVAPLFTSNGQRLPGVHPIICRDHNSLAPRFGAPFAWGALGSALSQVPRPWVRPHPTPSTPPAASC